MPLLKNRQILYIHLISFSRIKSILCSLIYIYAVVDFSAESITLCAYISIYFPVFILWRLQEKSAANEFARYRLLKSFYKVISESNGRPDRLTLLGSR